MQHRPGTYNRPACIQPLPCTEWPPTFVFIVNNDGGVFPMRSFLTEFALLLPLSAHAIVRTWEWPSTTATHPCPGTLQQCIDGASLGDTVLIIDQTTSPDGYTAIDEDISINTPITLTAAPDVDAVFAPHRHVRADLDLLGHRLAISHLVLRQGSIEVTYSTSTAGATVNIEHNRLAAIERTGAIGCGIDVKADGSTHATVNISSNVLEPPAETVALGSSDYAICVAQAFSASPPRDINIIANRIHATLAGSLGQAILVRAGDGTVRITRNSMVGRGIAGGILLGSHPATSSAIAIHNNVAVGIARFAAIEADLEDSAPTTTLTVVHNTVAYGHTGIDIVLPATVGTGRLANNIVAYQSEVGIQLSPTSTAVSNSHNLLHAVPDNPGFSADPSTVLGDPLFDSIGHPQPRLGSVALDAGNPADLPVLAVVDADGEKRVCNGNTDIGAFEFCWDAATSLLATPSNTEFNTVWVDHYPTMLYATDLLFATPRYDELPSPYPNLGVWRDTDANRWEVFHQNLSPVPLGRTFSVMTPVFSKLALPFVSTASALSYQEIDDARINGDSSLALIVMPQYTGPGTYHDHAIAATYTTDNGGRWRIRNEDGVVLSAGIPFNIMAPRSYSPNGLRVRAMHPLKHPLLDNNPCAAPIAGRFDDLGDGAHFNLAPFSLQHAPPTGPGAPSRWKVRNATPDALFNVVVNGGQANACRASQAFDTLLADGFE